MSGPGLTPDLLRRRPTVGRLDARAGRLTKLDIAIGAPVEGTVRPEDRKVPDAGADISEIRHVAPGAIRTARSPAVIAAPAWIDEALKGADPTRRQMGITVPDVSPTGPRSHRGMIPPSRPTGGDGTSCPADVARVPGSNDLE